jgi:hypothetical protein
VIEVQTFRLAPGVDDDTFLSADRRVQTEFIPNHPGFARRTTARGEDGEWAVITLWSSADEADASARLGETDAVMQAFVALIDASTYRVARYTELPG